MEGCHNVAEMKNNPDLHLNKNDNNTDVNKARIMVEPDRAKAIALALSQAHPDDTILIAGKGHEDYQIIGNTRYPFSDANIVNKFLNEGMK